MMTENEQKLAEALKWPESEADVTVDAILRCVGADTQRTHLEKWARIDKEGDTRSPLYRSQTQEIISAVGLMACLRKLREVSPAAADEFARDYWGMCDAGDSFGELLWEFTEAAGLDPSLITLPVADGGPR